LKARYEGEVIDLNDDNVVDVNKVLPCRESGSLEWRSGRGEMGKVPSGGGVMDSMAGYKDITNIPNSEVASVIKNS